MGSIVRGFSSLAFLFALISYAVLMVRLLTTSASIPETLIVGP